VSVAHQGALLAVSPQLSAQLEAALQTLSRQASLSKQLLDVAAAHVTDSVDR